MKKLRRLLLVVVTTVLFAGGILLYWQHDQPRRGAIQSIFNLASSLTNPRGSELLDTVLIPPAVQSETQAEQREFISKALANEVSPQGVLALKRHAIFGSAKSVFPDECAKWCQRAGVNADDCVAFKMERAGIRAEVVLVREGLRYRVVRCNNVKQMAEGT